MRVVAFAVVACGCGVAGAPGIGALAPRDGGVPERVITDAALWADVRAVDANVDASVDAGAEGPLDVLSVGETGNRDGAGIPDVAAGDEGGADGGNGGAPCELLARNCPNRQGCYPYPFESSPVGETRCAFVGVGGESTPCQSQLECDGATLCSAPGQGPDSVCLPRCDSSNPQCPIGLRCIDYPNYPGVGVCL